MIPRIKLFILLFYISTLAAAQKYPVQINARLIPPFSGYLPEYGLPGSEKFKVVLLLTDFNKGQYPVKLQFKLEGNGISISTKPGYNPAGIILDAGVPLELSSEQLNSYFTADHLDFSGLDPDTYEKTQTLPEGHYTLCVTAYAYNSPSPVQVSNNACAMAWLMQSDPPRLNTPICGSSIKITTPQQIIFKWLNMNAGSPNGAGTEYELSLYEIRPKERNPNDVIATIKPILQTTTDFTTYVYGISDSPLIPGMEYVWRVQAKDKSGKASIKNNGYSEACTFTYGSKYDEVSLTLNSKALNYTQAQLSWDSASPFKPFTLNYRKKGTEFWFTATTDSTIYKLSNLEQSTDYEARVQGQAADYTSQWSNTSTFQTQENAAIACGSTLPLTPTNNTKPLPAASPGMLFKVGNFELLVTSITGSNGTFTGYGKIKVPFLGIGLNAKYDNIFVNDEKTVTTGEVKIVSDKIDDWVNDNTIGTVHSGQETTDHVINFPTNTSNIQVNGNNVIIKGNDGQSTTIPYIPGTETTIKDSSGNLYVIDKNGKVEQIGKSGKGTGPIAKNLNYLNTRHATAEFTANPNQQNGFDAFTYEKLKRYYEQLRDTNKNSNVTISWKSTPAGKTDVVDVSISTKGKKVNPDSIIFITGTGTQYYATGNGNKKTLRVLGGAHGDVQELFAAYRDKNELVFIGKLNVVSYKANSKKVVLVPFNNSNTPTAQDIQQQLNQVYAQAITSFDVSVAAPLTVDKTIWDKDNNGRLNAGSDLLSRYSTELKSINSILRQQPYYDKNTYYIILTGLQADSLNDDIQGEMPRGRNIGYLFNTKNTAQQARLIAHELGHGAFALEHTFDGNTPIDKGTTTNLMDYASEKHLHKYQWSYVQQPVIIIGVLEDDEDAASKSICNSPANNYFLAPNGKVFMLPANSKLETIGSTYNGFLAGFSINGTVYVADINFLTHPDPLFNGYKSNTGNAYTTNYYKEPPAKQGTYVCAYTKDKLQLYKWQDYVCPEDADENTTKGTANYYYPATGPPVCVIDLSKGDNPSIDELFNSLKKQSIPGTVCIFKDNTLLKFTEGKPAQKTSCTAEQLKTLKESIAAGTITGNTTVLFEQQANQKYTVTVGFSKSLQARAGYGNNDEVKKKSKQLLESKATAYLDASPGLNAPASIADPGNFSDGKRISFNGSQTFCTVIANVVHDAAVFIQQAEIPAPYYNSSNTAYANNWINTPPLVTGVANGFINEAKDIPALIAFGADIAMNKEVQGQLKKSLSKLTSWEGIKTVASGAVKDWKDNYTQGGDQAWHQAGKDAVAVFSVGKAATAIASSIKNGLEKKVDDVVEGVAKGDKLLNAFINGWTKEKILELPKGKRPLPSEYLKPEYIAEHLAKFDNGASFLVPKSALDKYGRTLIGRPDGQFVMGKLDMDNLLAKANGNLSIVEKELGIPDELWKDKELVRIDISDPKQLDIRLPSGNEGGANELWLPGGKLPKEYSEAVINQIPQGTYTETLINIK